MSPLASMRHASLETQSNLNTTPTPSEKASVSRWNASRSERIRNCINDQEGFERVLATHRNRLINTPEIASHLNKSILKQLCSLSNSEAVRLLVYHVATDSSGLQDVFEEYCQDNADLKQFLITTEKEGHVYTLDQRLPPNANSLSRKAGSSGPISHNKSLRKESRPLSPLTRFQEESQGTVLFAGTGNPYSSNFSSSTSRESDRLTYASYKEALVITAPMSTIGAIHSNEAVEMHIALKEQYLPSAHTEILFNLVGTCLICQFKSRWHANFSTHTGVSISDSSVFSLSSPTKSQQALAGGQATTYSLLASIRIPDLDKCHCQRPAMRAIHEGLQKPTNPGAVDYLLNVTGTPLLPASSLSKGGWIPYSAIMPITTYQINRSKVLSSNIPVVINKRVSDLAILFSWKVQPQRHMVEYILKLTVCQEHKSLIGKLKRIGRRISVALLWKTQACETSPVMTETLRVGRQRGMDSISDKASPNTCLRIKGIIELPSSNRPNSTLCMASSWYEIQVKSSVFPFDEPLFSAPLKD